MRIATVTAAIMSENGSKSTETGVTALGALGSEPILGSVTV
jgi:hypothetical protein